MRDVGIAIIGQTGDLVPADKLLYGLRDVTATVDQLSLIAASIMSKKLAAGAQAIVLDVKVGDGAFMKTLEDARALAETMLALGREAGREVVCLLTDMDQPLGAAVGNALEVREALDTVRGHGPADFTELVLDACGKLLALSDLGIDEAEGRSRAEAGGRRRLRRGDLAALDRGAGRHGRRSRARRRAPIVREVSAPRAGHVDDARRDRASGSPPSTSAPAGGRRATRSTTRSASSAARKRGDAGRGGRGARRGARARRGRRAEAVARGRWPPTRSADERAARTRPSARGRQPRDDAAGTVAAMPELPEVETVRRRLAPVLEGRRFDGVEIADARLTRPFDPTESQPSCSRASASLRSIAAASI